MPKAVRLSQLYSRKKSLRMNPNETRGTGIQAGEGERRPERVKQHSHAAAEHQKRHRAHR